MVVFSGALLSAGQQAQPSPQAPTFKAQVEFVEVDALVTDQQGNFVRDLTKDDFQVFEDGKLQTISTFTLVDIPIERLERPLLRRFRSSRTCRPTNVPSTAACTS